MDDQAMLPPSAESQFFNRIRHEEVKQEGHRPNGISQKPLFNDQPSFMLGDISQSEVLLEDEASIKHPYTYQKKIVEKVLTQWGLDGSNPDKEAHLRNYGSIIFIETGAGKSYISLMLIKSLFGEQHEQLVELTPEQLKNKKMNSQSDLLDPEGSPRRKKVVFIVPTNNLVDQQSSVIERYTDTVRVGKFQGKNHFLIKRIQAGETTRRSTSKKTGSSSSGRTTYSFSSQRSSTTCCSTVTSKWSRQTC